MGKMAYLVTCKDSVTTEKYIFRKLEDAEKCLAECVSQAFEWEETDVDDDDWNAEECVANWEFTCGSYSAKLEMVDVF